VSTSEIPRHGHILERWRTQRVHERRGQQRLYVVVVTVAAVGVVCLLLRWFVEQN